jgi:vitamin B12 transporter
MHPGPSGKRLTTENSLLSWQNDIAFPWQGFAGCGALGPKSFPKIALLARLHYNNAVFAGWNANYRQHRWQISGRNDDHSQFGNKGTYALAYGYQLAQHWRLQGSYGTSFKAPSLYQLYDQWSGNAQLKPEEGKNAEAAVVWETGNQTASATYYHNRVENMIDWSYATYKYQNVSRAKLEGVTLDYNARFVIGAYTLPMMAECHRRGHWIPVGVGQEQGSARLSKIWGPLETGVELVGAGSGTTTTLKPDGWVAMAW